MRTITYYLATNQVVESDAIYPNAFSADDNTTQLIFDYTGTACATWDKWLDLTMSDYTKDVQSLGTGTVVTFNLGAEHTKKGLLQINPYAKSGTDKHGFPIYKLTIERQLNNSTVDASAQQSMIDYFDDRLTVKAVSATTLAPSESATASVTTEADGTTYVFGIPQGATGANGADGATGAKGDKGAQWRGAYSAGTAYVIDDVVSYNGSSYICILASTGNLPTNATYWSLVAEKGADGAGGGSTLVASYTHMINTEIIVSSVDVDTDTFTSVNHGLSNGDYIYPWTNNTNASFLRFSQVCPGGMTQRRYFVVNKTNDTFQISQTSGGAVVDLTTNAGMDLTKWHFEKHTVSGVSISGLNLTKCKIRVFGRFTYTTAWYLYPTNFTEFNYIKATGSGNLDEYLNGSIYTQMEYDFMIDDTLYIRRYSQHKLDSGSAVTTNTINDTVQKFPKSAQVAITGITLKDASTNLPIANGTKIEVYSL